MFSPDFEPGNTRQNFDNVEAEEHLFHATDLTSAFEEVDSDQLNVELQPSTGPD